MAGEQGKAGVSGDKAGAGRNRPKAQDGRSAKEQSKAQSRPVSTKAAGPRSAAKPAGPAKGSGGGGPGRGGNRSRPDSRPASQPPTRRFSGAVLAWGAVGLVVVIVAVLVIVKVTSGSSTNLSYTPVTPAPASVVRDVSSVPASVFNQVGVTGADQVAPPVVSNGNPPLTIKGKTPTMLYYGAEYCPYCAAERWAMAVALARFGTWSGLKTTASSHSDVYPATPTFSFYGATLQSPYINFVPIETYSNVPLSGGGYTSLQQPTKEEAQAITTYSQKVSSNSSSAGGVSFPFVDIDNRVIISGSSFNPGILANLTPSEIAGGLRDPSNPATQDIVATANYITAGICAVSPNAPASVCKSPGVEAAAKSLKLS